MTEANPFTDALPEAHDDDAAFENSGPTASPYVEVRGRRAQSRRQGLYGAAENRLLGIAEDGKTELARSFDGLVTMAREIAAQVENVGGAGLAGYASQAATALGDFQERLHETPVDELLDEGRELIRHSPRLAVGVAVVAGFLAARLVKSSGR